ncbi:MAG: pitrilysin family protein [Cytophagales bacterium]|nr:pitrilysin family protein [Cytophagales bacterium]
MRIHTIHTLKNGIRVVHNRVTTTKIVHCGLMLDIGSRDETPANQGIAHFWEHMAFKGTRKRKAFHIINRLESLGGELNAFTDKEKILFYASLRDDYFERALELLTDITFESVFPSPQIERERNVILEEMSMYYDDPEGSLQDEFDRVIFGRHPMGMNILGTEKTILSFRRQDFKAFMKRHLDTRRIVFTCVGNLSMEEVVRLAEKHLGSIPRIVTTQKRKRVTTYTPRELGLKREVKQARCAMGRTAYNVKDPRRGEFFLLTNILGGSGMNSRLNLSLREKHGIVYSIGSQFIPFTDTGLFVISFGTEPSQLSRSIRLVREELRKLRDNKLGVKQLTSAKEQIMGQVAMAEESNLSFMFMMGRSMLDLGQVPSLEEMFSRVQGATADSLRDMANEIFVDEQMSCLRMEPNTK